MGVEVRQKGKELDLEILEHKKHAFNFFAAMHGFKDYLDAESQEKPPEKIELLAESCAAMEPQTLQQRLLEAAQKDSSLVPLLSKVVNLQKDLERSNAAA